MNLVKLLQLVLALASKLGEYVRDRQLLDAGASQAILKGLKDADAAIARANVARAEYDSLPIDQDPENRDNRG